MKDYEVIPDGPISAISIVKSPANRLPLVCSGDLVTGCILEPFEKILRVTKPRGFHNVFLTEESIRQLIGDLSQSSIEFNAEHSKELKGIKLVESYITTDKKLPPDNLDVKLGSWLVTLKIEDVETLERIKKGLLKGLSLEAEFIYKEDINEVNDLYKILKNINKYAKSERIA